MDRLKALEQLVQRYHFAASQAQQLAWLRENCPSLFPWLQAAAKKGDFHAAGGTWVEVDGNLRSELCARPWATPMRSGPQVRQAVLFHFRFLHF